MKKIVCGNCKAVYKTEEEKCPVCNMKGQNVYNFKNSDEYLKEIVPKIIDERKKSGLEGLVKGLEFVIINTEEEMHKETVNELLNITGLEYKETFEDDEFITSVLKSDDAPDFLIRYRKGKNPFMKQNIFPKTKHLPNIRLETFVFRTDNIGKYVSIQKERGIDFMTGDVIHKDGYSFIQTQPSKYTGNSIGFVEWHNKKSYSSSEDNFLKWNFPPKKDYLRNVKELDHSATRVRAGDRDNAIIEFMELTNYNFDFAIYVKIFNSITNVARLSSKDFAMVFTSGISPYVNDEISGPTEKFIHNYGTRVHHIAFRTEKIEDTFYNLKKDGMNFLIELVGSKKEGIKQTFSFPSKNTLLVNEYIQRYDDFDGFFTPGNVTLLTESTEKQ